MTSGHSQFIWEVYIKKLDLFYTIWKQNLIFKMTDLYYFDFGSIKEDFEKAQLSVESVNYLQRSCAFDSQAVPISGTKDQLESIEMWKVLFFQIKWQCSRVKYF